MATSRHHLPPPVSSRRDNRSEFRDELMNINISDDELACGVEWWADPECFGDQFPDLLSAAAIVRSIPFQKGVEEDFVSAVHDLVKSDDRFQKISNFRLSDIVSIFSIPFNSMNGPVFGLLRRAFFMVLKTMRDEDFSKGDLNKTMAGFVSKIKGVGDGNGDQDAVHFGSTSSAKRANSLRARTGKKLEKEGSGLFKVLDPEASSASARQVRKVETDRFDRNDLRRAAEAKSAPKLEKSGFFPIVKPDQQETPVVGQRSQSRARVRRALTSQRNVRPSRPFVPPEHTEEYSDAERDEIRRTFLDEAPFAEVTPDACEVSETDAAEMQAIANYYAARYTGDGNVPGEDPQSRIQIERTLMQTADTTKIVGEDDEDLEETKGWESSVSSKRSSPRRSGRVSESGMHRILGNAEKVKQGNKRNGTRRPAHRKSGRVTDTGMHKILGNAEKVSAENKPKVSTRPKHRESGHVPKTDLAEMMAIASQLKNEK